jgi:hypothetical protein
MAIINSYPTATPKGADLLIGTQVKDDTVTENSTKSFTVDSLGSYIVTSTSGITGSGTLNTIAMFKPDGQTIGDSWLTQERIPGIAINYLNFDGPSGFQNRLSLINGYIETYDLQVTNITAGDTGIIDLQGSTTLGNSTSDVIWHRGTTYLTGPVLDTSNNTGTTGQILVSNANSQLEWKSYSESGATFLGWARYDGTPSFSNGTEVTVLDGAYIDPPVSLVTNQVIDPYTNGTSGKFVFTSNDLNAVYSLTVVFKASAANANQTHIDIDFVSGATDYERLSKSIGFYKGNDIVDNFHEMFQFYVDSDLITYGLQPRLYAQGGDVKFGDVIFFIQKQQQPAI